MKNISIVKSKTDAEIDECAGLMLNSDPWKSLNVNFNILVKTINDSTIELFLALQENKILGFAAVQMNGVFTGYIKNIAVKEEFRNQKIGLQLLKFVEERIFTERKNVFLCVSSFNKKAIRFYERNGYEKVGELKNYLINKHSEFIMRKTIGPLYPSKQHFTSLFFITIL